MEECLRSGSQNGTGSVGCRSVPGTARLLVNGRFTSVTRQTKQRGSAREVRLAKPPSFAGRESLSEHVGQGGSYVDTRYSLPQSSSAGCLRRTVTLNLRDTDTPSMSSRRRQSRRSPPTTVARAEVVRALQDEYKSRRSGTRKSNSRPEHGCSSCIKRSASLDGKKAVPKGFPDNNLRR